MESITAGLKVTLLRVIAPCVSPDNFERLKAFYNKVFPKWFFNGLRHNRIDQHTFQPLVPLVELVLLSDVEYFERIHQMSFDINKHDCTIKDVNAIIIKLDELSPMQKDRVKDMNVDIINKLRSIYVGLGGSNNFLSVPPGLKSKLGVVELFGCVFNTSGEYCSALTLEKEYCGSLGSFFDTSLVDGKRYLANPPFDETITKDMVVRLNEQLANTKDVVVIVILPKWKPPFEASDLIEASPYKRESIELTINSHKYFDYNKQKFIGVCASIMYILSNSQWMSTYNARSISNVWRDACRH